MLLPRAAVQYDQSNETQTRGILERADNLNVKVGDAPILTSPNGTRWKGTISNAGTVTWTAL